MKVKSILLTAVATLVLAAATMAQVPSYVPTNGLVGWWPFNGNANDESGNGYNGAVNGASLTSDRDGNANSAYSFDGISNYISTSNIPTFSNSNQITFSLWVKVVGNNASNSAAQYFISRGTDVGSGSHLVSIFQGANNTFYMGINGNANAIAPTVTESIPQVSWHHIVSQWDGSNVKLFIDGILVISNPYSQALGSLTSDLFFGKHAVSSFPYYTNGKLDDIGIWNRALSQQEITELFNSVNCANNTAITPQTNSLATGSTATFTASTSDPNPSFVWQSDFGLGFQNLQNVGQYAVVNTDSLSVSNLQLRNHQQALRVISTSGNCVDTSEVATISIVDTCLFTQYESVTTDTIRIVVTGINPPDYLNTIRVYPNPATQGTELQIDFGDFATLSGYKLRIENAQGQQIFQTNIDHDNDTIGQSVLGGTGVYFVRILDAQGNNKMTRKILVQ